MMMVGNVFSYLYQIIMGRMLSVEDYGTLNALFSMFVISSVPGSTISLVVSKYIAEYNARGEEHKVGFFLRKVSLYICLFTLILTILGLIASPAIKSFLVIEKASYVILIIISVGCAFLLPIATGAVQGFKRFWSLGILNLINPVIKLVFGILFVLWGWMLDGAIGGLVISSVIAVLIGFIMLRKDFKVSGKRDFSLGRNAVIKYSIPVLLATFCMAILTNIDMIMIKRYFSSQQAGLYGSAVIFGRAIFYFPGAIVMAMFPLVAEANAINSNVYKSLSKALLYTGIVCGAGVLTLNLFPEVIIKIFFGARYLPAIPYIKLISLTMLPLCLLSIVINFNLAVNQVRLAIASLILGCIAGVSLIVLYHTTISQVLFILIGIGVVVLIINLVGITWNKNAKSCRSLD